MESDHSIDPKPMSGFHPPAKPVPRSPRLWRETRTSELIREGSPKWLAQDAARVAGPAQNSHQPDATDDVLREVIADLVAAGMADDEERPAFALSDYIDRTRLDADEARRRFEQALRHARLTRDGRKGSLATATDHRQHGAPPPAICWLCGKTSFWKAKDLSARWLCGDCAAPSPDVSVIWYHSDEASQEQACREARWSEDPGRDEYLRRRIRKCAADAAAIAAGRLGLWRPETPRTTANLRARDFHATTDSYAFMAAARELRAWAADLDPESNDVARAALAEVLGWPPRLISPVLDHALELLRRMSREEAIDALRPAMSQERDLDTASIVPLRIDEKTTVFVPADPHALLLLAGVRPKVQSHDRTPATSQVAAG